jgi:hypothetical protein
MKFKYTQALEKSNVLLEKIDKTVEELSRRIAKIEDDVAIRNYVEKARLREEMIRALDRERPAGEKPRADIEAAQDAVRSGKVVKIADHEQVVQPDPSAVTGRSSGREGSYALALRGLRLRMLDLITLLTGKDADPLPNMVKKALDRNLTAIDYLAPRERYESLLADLDEVARVLWAIDRELSAMLRSEVSAHRRTWGSVLSPKGVSDDKSKECKMGGIGFDMHPMAEKSAELAAWHDLVTEPMIRQMRSSLAHAVNRGVIDPTSTDYFRIRSYVEGNNWKTQSPGYYKEIDALFKQAWDRWTEKNNQMKAEMQQQQEQGFEPVLQLSVHRGVKVWSDQFGVYRKYRKPDGVQYRVQVIKDDVAAKKREDAWESVQQWREELSKIAFTLKTGSKSDMAEKLIGLSELLAENAGVLSTSMAYNSKAYTYPGDGSVLIHFYDDNSF